MTSGKVRSVEYRRVAQNQESAICALAIADEATTVLRGWLMRQRYVLTLGAASRVLECPMKETDSG